MAPENSIAPDYIPESRILSIGRDEQERRHAARMSRGLGARAHVGHGVRRSGRLAAASAPGGSRNGAIGIGAYSTSTISRCSLFVGARTTTRSPGPAFISARANGDIQLM